MEPVTKDAAHGHEVDHGGQDGHGHSHGLVDRSIVRSREGVKAVSISLAVLGIAAPESSSQSSRSRVRWRCSPI
jgi:hypothetical protein